MATTITIKANGDCKTYYAEDIVSIEMFDADQDNHLPAGFTITLKRGTKIAITALGRFEFNHSPEVPWCDLED